MKYGKYLQTKLKPEWKASRSVLDHGDVGNVGHCMASRDLLFFFSLSLFLSFFLVHAGVKGMEVEVLNNTASVADA